MIRRMPLLKNGKLSNCLIDTNCVLVEWKFSESQKPFQKAVKLAENIPRTKVIETTDNYWHGVCRSLIFRFPDDLEILKVAQQGIIQVKSSSQMGILDLGVNQNRINFIYRKLMLNNEIQLETN